MITNSKYVVNEKMQSRITDLFCVVFRKTFYIYIHIYISIQLCLIASEQNDGLIFRNILSMIK